MTRDPDDEAAIELLGLLPARNPGLLARVLCRQLRRREVLRVGGASVLSAAVLAACDHHPPRTLGAPSGGATPTSSSSTTSTTLLLGPGQAADILVLRTASSLEHYAVGVYTQALGLDVVRTPSVAQAIELFAGQHSQHGTAIEQATVRAGGLAYSEPNPVLSRAAVAQIHQLRSEQEVVRFLYGVESLAAATYTASVGGFDDPDLNATVMSVGAVEARHLAVLGTMLAGLPAAAGTSTPPYPATGFEGATGGVAPGFGL